MRVLMSPARGGVLQEGQLEMVVMEQDTRLDAGPISLMQKVGSLPPLLTLKPCLTINKYCSSLNLFKQVCPFFKTYTKFSCSF